MRSLCSRRYWGIGILVMAVTSSAFAAERGMTPRDVAGLDYVGSALISPDGSRIAYTISRPQDPYRDYAEYEAGYEDGGPKTELHVMNVADGSSTAYMTTGSFGGLKWTPDGSALSFTAKRGDDENRCLYVLPLSGGEARRVLAHETDIGDYSWHPGGRSVAFIAGPKEDKQKKELKKKGFKAEVYEEELHSHSVWIGDLSDGFNPHRKVGIEGNVLSVEWSPSGDRLLTKVSPTPLIDDEYMATRIRVVSPETGDVITRIENPGKLGSVEWSPDGRNVAMISAADINDPSEGRLMVVSSDGGEMRDLIPNYPGHIKSIAWQGNGTLMFVGDQGCETVFGEVNIDGSELNTFVGPGGVILESMSLAKVGNAAAFVATSPTHYRELFYLTQGDQAPKRMTVTNPWLSEIEFGEQSVVKYKARDGMELEGILIKPVNHEPGTRVPCIVCVHGGPEAHESNGWQTHYSRPGQVAAAKGFAVFYPNYRGSTGRGVAFSKLSQGRYGLEEFDDVVDGVKHLVEMGLVDDDRVGITGGSYGGYASAWGATALTEHFAASVMFVGISEQFSKFGTTDIPNEMHLVHSRTWPWKDEELFRRSSPIAYAEQARTPILIMHGKDDTRVHPSQSMVLYRYLKTLGNVPVRLVFYPGEGHGNRKAGARLDYNLRMMRWMEHYLAPGNHRNDAPPPSELDYGLPEKKKDDNKEDGKAAAA